MSDMLSIPEWVNLQNKIVQLETENKVMYEAMLMLSKRYSVITCYNWNPEDIVQYFILKAREEYNG